MSDIKTVGVNRGYYAHSSSLPVTATKVFQSLIKKKNTHTKSYN